MARTQPFMVQVKSQSMADFWAQTSLAMDACTIGTQESVAKIQKQPNTLREIKIVLSQADWLARIQAYAPQVPTTALHFNHEGVTYQQYLIDQAATYNQIQPLGYTMNAVPTGTTFDAIVANGQLATMIASCDRAIYQTNAKQEQGAWIATSVATVLAWKNATAKSIGVQLSTSPPANPTATPSQVIADTDALLAAFAAAGIIPAWVKLFYRASDIGRNQVAQAVFINYMGGSIVSGGSAPSDVRHKALFRGKAHFRTKSLFRTDVS